MAVPADPDAAGLVGGQGHGNRIAAAIAVSRDFAPVGAVIGRATNLVPGVGRHLASEANVAVQGVLVHDVSKARDH